MIGLMNHFDRNEAVSRPDQNLHLCNSKQESSGAHSESHYFPRFLLLNVILGNTTTAGR